MTDKNQSNFAQQATGALALTDGTVFLGIGAGASGTAVGELCFNTAMTGYQEILTDPSYAEQVVLFTFPHIGNVGAYPEDHEESSVNAARAAVGTVFREAITPPPRRGPMKRCSPTASRATTDPSGSPAMRAVP